MAAGMNLSGCVKDTASTVLLLPMPFWSANWDTNVPSEWAPMELLRGGCVYPVSHIPPPAMSIYPHGKIPHAVAHPLLRAIPSYLPPLLRDTLSLQWYPVTVWLSREQLVSFFVLSEYRLLTDLLGASNNHMPTPITKVTSSPTLFSFHRKRRAYKTSPPSPSTPSTQCDGPAEGDASGQPWGLWLFQIYFFCWVFRSY